MEPQDDSDRTLLAACRAGDAGAWERLVTKYERLVFSIPLNYGLPREDAADIAQRTFTSFIEQLDRLSDDSRLGAWLATVSRRYTWRVIERSRGEAPVDFALLEEQATLLGDVRDPLERWAFVEWLHGGLAALNDRCRALLLALYFAPAEPSYADLAARLGLAVGSIGPTRARCLERLKQQLQE
jgi:RNA polymerase sigma factor (sigma-70 family)